MLSFHVILFLSFSFQFINCENNDLTISKGSINDEIIIGEEETQPSKIFQATNEWQEIGSDEILPKGLHVRINLQTGKKEAKLLDNEDEMDVHSKVTSNYQIVEHESNVNLPDNARSLRRMDDLKQFSKSNSIKFKDVEKEKKKINVDFKSESELLKASLEKYANENDNNFRIQYLSDLEYFVHSIDLANDLFKMGGFDHLFLDLNKTNSELKLAVLNVIGSAIQSNTVLKNELFQLDLLRHIIILINKSKEFSVLKRSLFVLSAFLRNFPIAQKSFFQLYNGFELLESMLNKDTLLASRTAALLCDLENEYSSAVSNNLASRELYDEIDFKKNVQNTNICFKLVQLTINEQLDRYSRLTLFESLPKLINICSDQFRLALPMLESISAKLSLDDYGIELKNLLKIIEKSNIKDEL